MTENPRIAELRRRVETDPASIAFAQLAEEYRREGDFEQAIQVCRTGLSQYPSYLSARVTLGRALAGLGRTTEARAELEQVLAIAPDNLAARRAIDELPQLASQHGGTERHPAGAAAASEGPSDGLAIERLEAWLEAILRDRAQRADDAAS